MRTIEVSTAAFAAIWANRRDGEESENTILERMLGVANKPLREAQTKERYGKKVRWVDDVETAIRELGGKAGYADIYDKVRQIRAAAGRSIPKSFEEVIRKEIETHSSDSEAFAFREDLFYAPEGLGTGVWAIR